MERNQSDAAIDQKLHKLALGVKLLAFAVALKFIFTPLISLVGDHDGT